MSADPHDDRSSEVRPEPTASSRAPRGRTARRRRRPARAEESSPDPTPSRPRLPADTTASGQLPAGLSAARARRARRSLIVLGLTVLALGVVWGWPLPPPPEAATEEEAEPEVFDGEIATEIRGREIAIRVPLVRVPQPADVVVTVPAGRQLLNWEITGCAGDRLPPRVKGRVPQDTLTFTVPEVPPEGCVLGFSGHGSIKQTVRAGGRYFCRWTTQLVCTEEPR